eukprot:1393416-Amorphochlora_amoeboformis.AAC.2
MVIVTSSFFTPGTSHEMTTESLQSTTLATSLPGRGRLGNGRMGKHFCLYSVFFSPLVPWALRGETGMVALRI